MFEPMALTVILALAAAFVLSLTFVPALVAHRHHAAGCRRRRTFSIRGAEARSTSRCCAGAMRRAGAASIAGAVAAVRRRTAAVHAARAGVRPDARREGHRDARDAHPEHGLDAVAGDAARRGEGGLAVSARCAFVFSKTGTAEMAVRPDAAERLGHLHHPEAARSNGPTRALTKDELIEQIEAGRRASCPATTTSSPSRSRCASTS